MNTKKFLLLIFLSCNISAVEYILQDGTILNENPNPIVKKLNEIYSKNNQLFLKIYKICKNNNLEKIAICDEHERKQLDEFELLENGYITKLTKQLILNSIKESLEFCRNKRTYKKINPVKELKYSYADNGNEFNFILKDSCLIQ